MTRQAMASVLFTGCNANCADQHRRRQYAAFGLCLAAPGGKTVGGGKSNPAAMAGQKDRQYGDKGVKHYRYP